MGKWTMMGDKTRIWNNKYCPKSGVQTLDDIWGGGVEGYNYLVPGFLVGSFSVTYFVQIASKIYNI